MIFIGLGANLDSPQHGSPRATLSTALRALETGNCTVLRHSSWYRSAPVPDSSQPWFVNGVAALRTGLDPSELLRFLHAVEDRFGRVRSVPNAARILDLDLLVYDDRILDDPAGPLIPHPRLHERAFVLYPLRELAPDWIDPRNGRLLRDMIRDLPKNQRCIPLTED